MFSIYEILFSIRLSYNETFKNQFYLNVFNPFHDRGVNIIKESWFEFAPSNFNLKYGRYMRKHKINIGKILVSPFPTRLAAIVKSIVWKFYQNINSTVADFN